MGNHPHQIVQKFWRHCSVLRDDGLSYGNCVEHLTGLLFFKMMHAPAQFETIQTELASD